MKTKSIIVSLAFYMANQGTVSAADLTTMVGVPAVALAMSNSEMDSVQGGMFRMTPSPIRK